MRTAITDASRSPVSPSELLTSRTIPPAPPGEQTGQPAPVGRAIAFSPTFYPGTTREEEASEVTVGISQELNNIVIPLRFVPASRLEGRVIGIDGQIATNAQVQLLKASGTGGFSSTSVSNRNGYFQATGVAAGRYKLVAVFEPPAGRGGAAPTQAGPSFAQLELNLFGDDQRDLVLQLGPLPTISGRVAFDGGQPSGSAVQISLEQVGGTGLANIREVRPVLAIDGAFTLTGVMPGRYRMNARVTLPPKPSLAPPPPPPGQPAVPPTPTPGAANIVGWSVASASVVGQDAYISPFEVKAGQSLTDAEITLTNKATDISGKLIDSNNKPVLNMTVVLFPVDRKHWLTNASRVNRISRPNPTGTFSFAAAIPGEYYLAVLTELDALDWADPEFKEQIVPAAIKISLARGEKKVQDFRIDR